MINKIIKRRLVFIFIGLSFLSCNKIKSDLAIESNQLACTNEAEIISFDRIKMRLMLGWIIKVENDAIKRRDRAYLGLGNQFGYTFDKTMNILH